MGKKALEIKQDKNCNPKVLLSELENLIYWIIRSKAKGISLSMLKKAMLTEKLNLENKKSRLNVKAIDDKKFQEILTKLMAINLVMRIKTKSKQPGIKYYSIDKIFGTKKPINHEVIMQNKVQIINANYCEVNIENFAFLKGDLTKISNSIENNEVLNEEIFTFDYEFISVLKEIICGFVYQNNLKKIQTQALANNTLHDNSSFNTAILVTYLPIDSSTNVEEILNFLNNQKIAKIVLKCSDICTLCDVLIYEDKLVECQIKKYKVTNNSYIENSLWLGKKIKMKPANVFFDEQIVTEYENFSIFDLFEAKKY